MNLAGGTIPNIHNKAKNYIGTFTLLANNDSVKNDENSSSHAITKR